MLDGVDGELRQICQGHVGDRGGARVELGKER